MKHIAKFALILSISLLATFQNTHAQQLGQVSNLSFKHIQRSKLEAIGYINAIIQDSSGFMWFGGSNGLARYDGVRLKIYRHDTENPNSLAHNQIYALLVDSKDTLWIGTANGLNRYIAEEDSFITYRQPAQVNTQSAEDDIRSLLEDTDGNIWLGTRKGLFLFNSKEITYNSYQLAAAVGSPMSDNIVWTIAKDRDSMLWVGTRDYGIARFNLITKSFHSYRLHDTQNPKQNYDDVRRLYIDSKDRIWAATYGGGIYLFDNASGNFQPFEHNTSSDEQSAIIWDFLEDRDGNIWVADSNGLTRISAPDQKVVHYSHSNAKPNSLGNFVPTRVFQDLAGDIWVGYYPSGVDLIDRQAATFKNFTHKSNDPTTISGGGVISFWEDKRGNIWLGTGQGLNYLDRSTGELVRTPLQTDNPLSTSTDTILSILEDHNENLWLGVWSEGLKRLNKGDSSFQTYSPNPKSFRSILGKEPWAMFIDKQQRMWVATEAGINRYNEKENNFIRYLPSPEQMGGDTALYTRALAEDSDGTIWIGSTQGLFQLDPETHQFKRYRHNTNQPSSLSNDYVISLLRDSKNRLWAGTHGGGLNLFDRKSGRFEHYRSADGLADDVVTSILEDDDGMLWLGTQQGLSRLDPSLKTFRNYNTNHGLSSNLFNNNKALKTHDGNLLFGNSLGFVMFDPKQLKANDYQPPVVFTGLRVFNQTVTHGADSILNKPIEQTDFIEISQNQSMITFEFAALNFRSPELNSYAYWLEGFDRDWLYVGNNRQATYTNLDSGNYTLHVKAANDDGVWSDQVTSLEIRILPPFWKTWWAYAVYFVLGLLLAYALVTFLLGRESLSKQRVLNMRLKEVDRMKDQFLANTSHKLRTPLSAMTGLAESLLRSPNSELDESTRRHLVTITNSGKQLSRLINEVVDYSQLADNKLKLHFQPVDIYILTDLVFSLITPLVAGKPLRLVNALSPNMPRIHADEQRLRQILINLLSNAIKYTDEGFITVSGELQSNRITISVEDSGMGIAEDKLETIFYPFQHSDAPEDDDIRVAGTSLGLTVCRKLVELHGGTIKVRSALGAGSEFIFDLPLADSNASKTNADTTSFERPIHHLEQSIASEAPIQRSPKGIQGSENYTKLTPPKNAEEFTVLIVDDDTASRMMLNAMLNAWGYRVLEASSGEEALKVLDQNSSIDLIILDVIMPGMNGYKTCEEIRKHSPLEQLPILFLSASNRDREILTGYSVGGNDFLTKPVTSVELMSKVNLQLKLTHRIRTKK